MITITLVMRAPNSTSRFSERADNYDLYRPGYPAAIVSWLEQTIGLTTTAVIADIGAGTGIFTDLFLAGGYTVNAVEPNAAMRTMALKNLQQYKNFNNINGTAAQTSLPDHSINLVTAAQAFHWFDQEEVKKEFTRILQPGGHVLLVWNILQSGSPFLKAYKALKEKYEEKDAHPVHANHENIYRFFSPAPVITHELNNVQLLDAAGLKGLLLSSSKIPLPADPRYELMMNELDVLTAQFSENGLLKMEYSTKLFLARMGS